MVPLSTSGAIRHPPRGFLSINHQGQFPAVTLSFNLAPGAALGQAVDAIRAHFGGHPHAGGASPGTFQGTAQAFQALAAHRAAT